MGLVKIDKIENGILPSKWWVGEKRWADSKDYKDLEKATLIYYNMYEDLTSYEAELQEQYNNRFRLMDEICPQRNWILVNKSRIIHSQVAEIAFMRKYINYF